MIFITLMLVLLFSFISSTADLEPIALAIMLFIIAILISFTTLKIMINENYLRIKFGYGIFRKSFPLDEITSARTIKNHWYYGWGIKLWLWPKTWIFNVSGFDAVEIKMKDGKLYRIGTDEPKELERAILRAAKIKVE